MSIQSLTLRFTNPAQQLVGSQEIPLASIQQPGSKSVAITNAGILAAFNANPEGTIFTPSIAANYGNDESGNPITRVTSPASNIPSFVPRPPPPPPPPITRAANGVTIQYTGSEQAVIDAYNSPTPKPLFILANPRGTLQSGVPQPEWFAVVTDASKAQITSYAKSTGSAVSAYFTPPLESSPVPFNNIITTLVIDMVDMFKDVTSFNKVISSWDTFRVINMSGMFVNASAFNEDVGSWDTSNVNFMFYMFYNATNFNQNISAWNVTLVTPKPPINFRTGSALITSNMPAAFR
jgi:surface protein